MNTSQRSVSPAALSQLRPTARRRRIVSGVLAAAVSIGAVSAWQADASSGDGASFVPTAPCRLFDTRPGAPPSDGIKAPVGSGDSAVRTQQVTGGVGDCDVPAEAVAVSMNVTAVNGTAQSNLRVFPADVATPTASNLNWLAGQSPTPNNVDVQLSTGGAIKLFNQNGTVDVVADVVGYYTPTELDALRAQVSELQAQVRSTNEQTESRLTAIESEAGALSGRVGSVEARTAFSVSASDDEGVEVGDDPLTVLRLNLTAPVDGSVMLSYSAQAQTFFVGAVLWCGVFKEGDVPPGSWNRGPGAAWTETDRSADEATLSATRGFSVAAGVPTTFELVCQRDETSGGFVSGRSMTAVFTAD
ncbi:MAG: hypothetical protein AAFY28_01975 [Actinomycetota bacterium]